MRFLVKTTMPTEVGNAAIRDGSMGQKIMRILEEQKPEAVYFVEEGGQRTQYLVINVDSVNQLPSIAEPWWLTFGGSVEFHPAMTPKDLEQAGLEDISKTWG